MRLPHSPARICAWLVVFGLVTLGAVLLPGGAAPAQTPVAGPCGATGCHPERVAELAASRHAGLSCLACHPDAAGHPQGYQMLSASQYFQMEICGGCHPDELATYEYDDGTATKYGGSAPQQPKYLAFPKYNTIIDGHGFVREYNEERAHAHMTQDHADTKRGKYEVCLQCKSTRVAYYWNSGRTVALQHDVAVTWAPTGDAFTVPANTTIKLGTDVSGALTGVPHQVMAEVTWGGKLYTSYDKQGATKDLQRTWLAVYAMAVDGLPAGSPSIANTATCNHCHDPHATELRVIRQETARAVGEKGVNPYAAGKTSFAAASRQDRIDTVCGQCHVEYVCGKSGVDGVDRDFIPWAKVADLEDLYRLVFPTTDKYGSATYGMDWVHGTGVRSSAWPNYAPEYPIAVPLIKNQHPETELYWQSTHYRAGLSCAECHLPTVTRADGTTFRSHWFASPLKYLDPVRAQAFATRFAVTLPASGVISQCAGCHPDTAAQRSAAVVGLQDSFYGLATEVQDLLVDSLKAINGAEATAGADQTKLKAAIANHRSAHVRWENLAVSENSMGFHNTEASTELAAAMRFAQDAIQDAQAAVTAATTSTTATVTTTSTTTTTASSTTTAPSTATTLLTSQPAFTG